MKHVLTLELGADEARELMEAEHSHDLDRQAELICLVRDYGRVVALVEVERTPDCLCHRVPRPDLPACPDDFVVDADFRGAS